MGFKVETNDLNQPQSRWDLCHENKDHVKSFLSSANHQNVKSHNGLCAVANLTSSTRFFFLLCLLVQKIRYGWNLQYIKDVARFFGPWSVMFSFSWFLFFNTAAGKKKEKKTQTMFPSLFFCYAHSATTRKLMKKLITLYCAARPWPLNLWVWACVCQWHHQRLSICD